jgi:hypothetical protein
VILRKEIRPETAELGLRVLNPLAGGKPLRFANRDQDRLAPGWLSLVAVPND